jgi:hypothetical protein
MRVFRVSVFHHKVGKIDFLYIISLSGLCVT